MEYVDGHCCVHCSVCVCPGLAEEIPSYAERLDAGQTHSLLTRAGPGGNTKHQFLLHSPPSENALDGEPHPTNGYFTRRGG